MRNEKCECKSFLISHSNFALSDQDRFRYQKAGLRLRPSSIPVPVGSYRPGVPSSGKTRSVGDECHRR